MKYIVEFLPDKGVVNVNIQGRINFQIVEEYSKEAIKLARKNDCKKFLLNLKEITLRKEMINLHTTGDELQQFGYKNTDRVAILIGNRASVRNFQDHGNINSSWSSIKYFFSDNVQDAFDWLIEIH